ncbi:unnamed protein product [Adineta steineri]|uniref:Uncharacterized protein n=1 Tax=Adineta steineri TaxID=433720 RepID=A0A814AHR7_9BILA|nr:unnamed protein product [Adineta steineri]
MANETQEDLNDFLSKVDDIHRLVQNLSSNDTNDVSKAMQESDVLLKEISKTGVNRTVINKSPSEPLSQQNVSQDAFMSAIEKDANERAENRRKNKILADELKAKGNEAFHQQLYEQAIDYYTQGLKLKKDYDVLYTNRAQVYVKQGRYEDAINDCVWALKATPTFIKAFVIKGKCLMNLKDFDRAKEEFVEAEQIAIKNFDSINTRQCIEEVERQRNQHQREESARIFLSNENPSELMNLTNTLKKLNTDKQPIIYYTGGIDLLCQLIKDETTRTAFRVNNGFNLFNSHSIIIENDQNENLSQAVFNLMIILSQDDDENTKQCLESKYLNNYLRKNNYSSIALQFLVDITLNTKARLILLQKINPNEFIQHLMNMINDKKSNPIYAAKLLSNLATESKIKQCFNNKTELIKLISIIKSSVINEQTRTVILSLLTNLCSEKTIRSYVIEQTELLQILIKDFEQTDNEHQLNLLGLFINLTNEKSTVLESIYKQLCELILTKLRNSVHQQRIFTLLGTIAMHYEQAVGILIQHNIVSWISQALQQNANEEKIRAAVRLLALCTQGNEQAQQAVANDKKRKFIIYRVSTYRTSIIFFVLVLSLIYEQLITSQHSLLIGNASLVFGHVIIHSSVRIFLKENSGIEKTIGQMLKLVEESWLSKVARKNVAIFITKLVKADERFLEEFRKQHGTEILHSALKDVEL